MNYYNQIKNELFNNQLYKKVKDYSKNRSDLETYYNVGKLIAEAQGGEARAKYGNGLIKDYSSRLTKELGKGYSVRSLRNMRQFYLLFEDGIWQTVSAKLSWSYIIELIWFEDLIKINYYINLCSTYNLSVREFRNKIKDMEYERLDNSTKEKLINKEENKIEDFIKNPILINNSHNYKEISEKLLKQLILEDLDNFLNELGEDFSYIKNEYKIKVDDKYQNDYLSDDSALVYKSDKGFFIITGCSHSGICNIIEHAKKVCKTNNIYGVIGDFHIFEGNDKLNKTIEYFKTNNIKNIYPCHCTSLLAKSKFVNTFGNCNESGVGFKIEI